MKLLNILFLLLFCQGCATVLDLGGVKRGEGQQIIFDLSEPQLRQISQKALEDSGLVVKKVFDRKERTEILAYQPASLGERGSIYGIFLYPLNEVQTELHLVRMKKYPSDAFSRDAREEILAKLDELALAAGNSK